MEAAWAQDTYILSERAGFTNAGILIRVWGPVTLDDVKTRLLALAHIPVLAIGHTDSPANPVYVCTGCQGTVGHIPEDHNMYMGLMLETKCTRAAIAR